MERDGISQRTAQQIFISIHNCVCVCVYIFVYNIMYTHTERERGNIFLRVALLFVDFTPNQTLHMNPFLRGVGGRVEHPRDLRSTHFSLLLL